ncbi:MAG: hypothetical protein WHT46_00390 [Candidatus Geothermincolales bacterium]
MAEKERVLLMGAGMTFPDASLSGRVTLGYAKALVDLGYEVVLADDLPHPDLEMLPSLGIPFYIEPLTQGTVRRLAELFGAHYLLWELRGGMPSVPGFSWKAGGEVDPFRQLERWRSAQELGRGPTSLTGGRATEEGWAAVAFDGEEAKLLAACLPPGTRNRQVQRSILEIARKLVWPGVWEMELELSRGMVVAILGVLSRPDRIYAVTDEIGGLDPASLHLRLVLGLRALPARLESIWLDDDERLLGNPGFSEMESGNGAHGMPDSAFLHPEDDAVMVKVSCLPLDGELKLTLWEELEESGFVNGTGLAVAPPCDLGKDVAVELLRKAVELLPRHRSPVTIKAFLRGGSIDLVGLEDGTRDWPFSFWIDRIFGSARVVAGGISMDGYLSSLNGKGPYLARIPAPVGERGNTSDTGMRGARNGSWGYRLAMGKTLEEVLARAVHALYEGRSPGRKVVLSVADRQKRELVGLARELASMGYAFYATEGTARALKMVGIEAEKVKKLKEGSPNILDVLRSERVDLVINVPRGHGPMSDGRYIREGAAAACIPCFTRVLSAWYLVRGMKNADPETWEAMPVELYKREIHDISSLAG